MTSAANARLASTEDHAHLFSVNYSYDYLRDVSLDFLQLPSLKLNNLVASGALLDRAGVPATASSNSKAANWIDIFPADAGIASRTALRVFRQSKYWRTVLSAGSDALQHFLQDDSFKQAVRSGKTFSKISAKLLQNIEDGFLRFAVYLFPEADEQQVKLLAIVMVYIFVFDDLWEMEDGEEVTKLRDDFVSRLQTSDKAGESPAETSTKTPLQAMIDQSIAELRQFSSTGGQEVIDELIGFCSHPPPPPRPFADLADYLAYRREDAAYPCILACTKFSIDSTVDIHSPRMAKIIELMGNHMIFANDLGSFAKEKRAFSAGKIQHLINSVHVVKQLLGLPSDEAAKGVVYGLQLQVECDMDAEVGRLLEEDGGLDKEEWRFLDACLLLTAGNLLCTSIMDRYGGEQGRL
ncbi:sesquiterpene cyclase protein [Diplodia corticola]|uniref:Terpene synthase n=1 Tax=Diplodia corticola TaxID=236234 RepID=A0A1J9QMC3_9PEZI|nr:sesquiterpene cyclase protein [Diplodia corticola]OJD30038.1 sesquiterpene cyclase protein [Diplodia corticola]